MEDGNFKKWIKASIFWKPVLVIEALIRFKSPNQIYNMIALWAIDSTGVIWTIKCTHNHFHNILKFWYFSKFLYHHKWNEAWLLVNKHGIYELPCELSNDLRLRIFYFAWKLESVSNILWMIVSGNNFLLLTRPRPLQT